MSASIANARRAFPKPRCRRWRRPGVHRHVRSCPARGDAFGCSDALLGIVDPIAPAAAAALAALAAGNRAQFAAILAPTLPLSRHLFGAPTRFYKTGVVFLAWLNDRQTHFVMALDRGVRRIAR